MAQVLNPPPRNLLEADFLEDLSPSRVYNTLKVGIPDTAMVSYDKILSDQEKWDLSFYVLALPYLNDKRKTLELGNNSRKEISWNLLATLSNKELQNYLGEKTNLAGKELTAFAESLRRAQFPSNSIALNKNFNLKLVQKTKSQDESLKFTLTKISEAKAKLEANNIAALHDDLLAGYLEGFESVERKLQILDSKLMRRIEKNFMALRAKAKAKNFDKQEFALELAALERDIHVASEILVAKKTITKASPLSDMIASAIIILREGLEAFLIIIALLSLVNNLGIKSARVWIHSAWVSAVVLGFATFYLIEKVFSLSGANRELLEAFFTGIAVFMLFYTGFWLLSQSQKKWTSL